MTERQAWLQLAEQWDKPTIDGAGTAWVDNNLGICRCLSLHPTKLRHKMLMRMERHMPKDFSSGSYWWPSNAEGAKQRAAFCRKMAELCRPARKRKKKVSQ